ncbi:uncharacterized protein BP01DRAFT_232588 [Aspergillus saccharolyticus JOP 1030-1]|uniref:Uncharacterized protein n=1 Tax=Aspergillus saccharolyticus JOP 1030-1 TaxID=1450539 RepID=A0A318YZT9_9EURO|nr:hypothetical protein BP01DRAFT_232588 [Aspergillus saccharolyticus JOP 1030-1]PYH40129.1 hypothetical protein BP01DRAFT_232588 [Aspergillus saccharolyticus JOP 1030-1]
MGLSGIRGAYILHLLLLPLFTRGHYGGEESNEYVNVDKTRRRKKKREKRPAFSLKSKPMAWRFVCVLRNFRTLFFLFFIYTRSLHFACISLFPSLTPEKSNRIILPRMSLFFFFLPLSFAIAADLLYSTFISLNLISLPLSRRPGLALSSIGFPLVSSTPAYTSPTSSMSNLS